SGPSASITSSPSLAEPHSRQRPSFAEPTSGSQHSASTGAPTASARSAQTRPDAPAAQRLPRAGEHRPAPTRPPAPPPARHALPLQRTIATPAPAAPTQSAGGRHPHSAPPPASLSAAPITNVSSSTDFAESPPVGATRPQPTVDTPAHSATPV